MAERGKMFPGLVGLVLAFRGVKHVFANVLVKFTGGEKRNRWAEKWAFLIRTSSRTSINFILIDSFAQVCELKVAGTVAMQSGKKKSIFLNDAFTAFIYFAFTVWLICCSCCSYLLNVFLAFRKSMCTIYFNRPTSCTVLSLYDFKLCFFIFFYFIYFLLKKKKGFYCYCRSNCLTQQLPGPGPF